MANLAVLHSWKIKDRSRVRDLSATAQVSAIKAASQADFCRSDR
jgi:hypothetical protein